MPVSVPSELVVRRPDIAAEERALAEAAARIGIARTAFFPSVRLMASAGQSSQDAGDLTARDSRLWSFGPSIHIPLFEGGALRAGLASAYAGYDAALARWRQSGLVAFREVQDALNDGQWLSARGRALGEAADAAEAAARLSRSRYDHGLAGYFEVVDTERQALNTELALVENERQRLEASVQLIKALGGGWTASGPALATAPVVGSGSW